MTLTSSPLLAYWGLTSTTWLVLWSVLATLTVLLLVLLRTNWSQAKPWRKCAILSLWVHVLLGCLAMTVRIVTGAPELGDQQPIRVAVVTVVAPPTLPEKTPEETLEETPEETAKELTQENTKAIEATEPVAADWEQPTEPALVVPETEPLVAPPQEPAEALAPLPELVPREPAPPLEAPALLESLSAPPAEVAPPTTEPTPEPPPEPTTESPEEPPEEPEPSAEPGVVAEEVPVSEPEQLAASPTDSSTARPVESPPQTNTEQAAEVYEDRFAIDREALVAARGGSPQTERAVRAALGWLASSQAEQGGWDASKYGAGAARMVLSQDRRGAGAQGDMGVTGLALLAFLGAGHTHTQGDYTHEVARGLEYLRQHQRSDGALYGEAHFFARMYCHSMATFAVCEALALTQDQRLEPMARAAVRYTLSMQHPTDGGWRYQRGDTGDTSQLGWQLMTLKSAQLAGLPIPAVTWTRAEHFLQRVRRGEAGGLAAYRPNSAVSRTMTAEALFCRQLQQEQQVSTLSPAAIAEAVAAVAEALPSSSDRNLYFWYYATLALQRSQQESPEAAAAWEDWNHALTTALLTTQAEDGGWDTATVWGGCGGRVYTTALSALCLEVYYRYQPTESPSQIADRQGWQGVHR